MIISLTLQNHGPTVSSRFPSFLRKRRLQHVQLWARSLSTVFWTVGKVRKVLGKWLNVFPSWGTEMPLGFDLCPILCTGQSQCFDGSWEYIYGCKDEPWGMNSLSKSFWTFENLKVCFILDENKSQLKSSWISIHVIFCFLGLMLLSEFPIHAAWHRSFG